MKCKCRNYLGDTQESKKEREEKKAKHPAGFELMNSWSQGMKSTATLQLLPIAVTPSWNETLYFKN